MEKLKGEFLKGRVLGRHNWGAIEIRTGVDSGLVNAVGNIPLGASAGDTVLLAGWWDEHPKWGKQFKFSSCEVTAPATAAGIISWLAAKCPQLGRRRAESIVERFGADEVWDVIEQRPEQLIEISGITAERRDEIVAAYHSHRGDRDRQVRLRDVGLNDRQIAQLTERWGDRVEEEIYRDPYQCMRELHGWGWTRADNLAQRMGIKEDSRERIHAAMMEALSRAANAGHCYLTAGSMVAFTARKIVKLDEEKVYPHARTLADCQEVVVRGDMVFLADLDEAEDRAAARIADMVAEARVAA